MREHGIHLVRFVRELSLSPAERGAARAERRAEAAIREERENRHSHERRMAALEAERHRQQHGAVG